MRDVEPFDAAAEKPPVGENGTYERAAGSRKDCMTITPGNLEARARALIDDRLFAAYWASVEHFGTTDLVLYFDTERDEDPVDAFVRERLVADPKIPEALASKVSRPAKAVATTLKGAATAFWLVVSFPDEEMVVTAVIAQRVTGGGIA